ncbi:MAG TPA: hypothetical protein VE080_00680 [Candidatus Aquicultoraceae bacterium]|nr:hypothetical protein [Candidatus Aquicultoraceae bacterium]
MRRKGVLVETILLGALLTFGVAMAPGEVRAADKDRPSLTMEELEVRGRREKLGTLFLPVPGPIGHPASVRMDLFREDMTRPILPWEIDIRQ